MEIHFHDHMIDFAYHSWIETSKAIESREPIIHTTQMALMSTQLLLMGYRIFVHEFNKKPYEIRLGANECTDKEIRIGHNLFKMWENGAFIKVPKIEVTIQ